MTPGRQAPLPVRRPEPASQLGLWGAAAADPPPVEEEGILLSIRPRFADLILSGQKTVELRRAAPYLPVGSPVVLYVAVPVVAVVGAFTVGGFLEAPPGRLWPAVASSSGVTRAEFDRYFGDAAEGLGILVDRTHRFPEPLPLSTMRELLPEFRPPQSYRFLARLGRLGERILGMLAASPLAPADGASGGVAPAAPSPAR